MSDIVDKQAAEIVAFWREIGPKAWFSRSDETDASIRERFGALHDRASRHEFDAWRQSAEGALALILLLDQFSRNLYRSDRRAFAQDAYCLEVAEAAIEAGFDGQVEKELRSFFYMPFMHSEAIADQRRCIAHMHALGNENNLKYAIIHHDVIARFGRFPHRNPALGRHTTPAEQAFLDAGGFSA